MVSGVIRYDIKSNWLWWILGIIILFTIYRTWLSKLNSLEVALELAGENGNAKSFKY